MTELGDQKTHHTKTSLALSGRSAAVLEHPSPNENEGLEDINRGRHGHGKQLDGSSTATESPWQMQGGQQEVYPGLRAGNAHPKYPAVTQPCQEPGADTAGEGGLAADGNSGDGPSEETHSQVQGECVPAGRPGRKKHRRRPSSKKKRRWKPYFKLTWEEKKECDERETARASRVREEMFAKGLPVAPYNTTQFLMEEHDREEPDLNTELGGRRSIGANRTEDTASEEDCVDFEEDDEEGSGGGSDGIGRPGNAGGEFLQRDFSETYEKYHVESLQSKTKQELVREYLELERCMSRLEEENNRLRLAENRQDLITSANAISPPDAPRLRELEKELVRLRAQNSELRLQNQLCKERGQSLSTGE